MLCLLDRFKLQAGHYWTSFDPYWTKKGPMMQVTNVDDALKFADAIGTIEQKQLLSPQQMHGCFRIGGSGKTASF